MNKKYDIAVLGGGMAGVSAAIAASEMGAKTALIERSGFLGGMVTGCFVVAMAGAWDGHIGTRQIVKGNFNKIVDRAIKEGAAEWTRWLEHVKNKKDGREVTTDPEGMKYVLDMLIEEASVELGFHAFVHKAKCIDNKIEKIAVVGKFGEQQIEAKTYVDCTGDADMAMLCGLDYLNATMGCTSPGVRIGGLDAKTVRKHEKAWCEKNDSCEALEYKEGAFNTFGWFSLRGEDSERLYDAIYVKNLCTLSIEDLTKAEIYGRRIMHQAVKELRQRKGSGYENAYVTGTGTHLGLRKSRVPITQYYMSDEDLDKDFEDSIAMGGDVTRDYGFIKISFRTLLPKRINNLIYAGRCISPLAHQKGNETMGSISFELPRLVAPCTATGEAAGVAAALCVDKDIGFDKLNVKEVQAELKKRGAIY